MIGNLDEFRAKGSEPAKYGSLYAMREKMSESTKPHR
jgi:hypothetical protein